MAKIVENIVVIKFSKLVKEQDPASTLITEDIRVALEQVSQELVGDGVVVEVEQAQ